MLARATVLRLLALQQLDEHIVGPAQERVTDVWQQGGADIHVELGPFRLQIRHRLLDVVSVEGDVLDAIGGRAARLAHRW